MDQEFKDFLQSIVNLSEKEKVNIGVNALSKFYNGLVKGGIPENDVPTYIIALTKLFVSADQKCNRAEYDFFRAVTGLDLSADKFYDLTNGGRDPEFKKACFEFLSVLNNEDKTAAVMYGCALLSCDDTINLQEIELIQEILK